MKDTIEIKRITHRESYSVLMQDRSTFQRGFVALILAERGLAGRVLDIGCGAVMPEPLRELQKQIGILDGVDLDPAVKERTDLQERWHARFEDANIPTGRYDVAYAYNVVEHIPAGQPFFDKVQRILKPGGVFWALTPHGHHPFCKLARGIELLGGKHFFHQVDPGVNDYPSYYRMNTYGSVMRKIEGMGFSKVHFHYFPCMQWDRYFPRTLRWLPHYYDVLLGLRVPRQMLIIAYRLETAQR